MPKTINWVINENGIDHQVILKSYVLKNDVLTVDGVNIPIPINFKNLFVMVEVPFIVGSKQCLYIKTMNNTIDLIVDGIRQSNQKPYVMLSKTPWWVWVFIATYVPLFLIGGFIPAFGAMMGMMSTYSYTRIPNKKTSTKVLVSFAISILIWLGVFCIAIIISSLFPTK